VTFAIFYLLLTIDYFICVHLRLSAVKQFFEIIIRLLFRRLEIEFLQYVLYLAAPHRLAYLRRPVIGTRLAPGIDRFQQFELLLFEGAQPLPALGY